MLGWMLLTGGPLVAQPLDPTYRAIGGIAISITLNLEGRGPPLTLRRAIQYLYLGPLFPLYAGAVFL